jgi:hypothetical protein
MEDLDMLYLQDTSCASDSNMLLKYFMTTTAIKEWTRRSWILSVFHRFPRNGLDHNICRYNFRILTSAINADAESCNLICKLWFRVNIFSVFQWNICRHWRVALEIDRDIFKGKYKFRLCLALQRIRLRGNAFSHILTSSVECNLDHCYPWGITHWI